MSNNLKDKTVHTFKSITKFFTGACFDINNWKWVKDKNEPKDFIKTYNYYPLNYYFSKKRDN